MSHKISRSEELYLDDLVKSDSLKKDIQRHILSALGNDFIPPRKDTYYNGLAYCIKDRLLEKWIKAQRTYYQKMTKRVYYLSMEFLPGPFLMNYIQSIGMQKECRESLKDTNFSLDELIDQEWDPGLGNGGLGRLASCYLDSMAQIGIPGYGYGIRYDYGIFHQKIVNGYQQEEADNWLRYRNPFEIKRQNFLFTVHFFGCSKSYKDDNGNLHYRWVDTETVNAMASDTLIPGYQNDNVVNMRLWIAVASGQVDLQSFNKGDYIGAMESKVLTENISKVLYPSDEAREGKELRLKQQYFFVSATFQDIIRRFKKDGAPFSDFPKYVAVQLNDTHPAISIPELMRILLDIEGLSWDESWQICRETFAYTNHTVLPEALETWPVSLIGKLLPRHMAIIYEINAKFLEEIQSKYPDNDELIGKLSIIKEGPEKMVRMAHLAIIGSHSVNGVAELHTNILITRLFKDFHSLYPGKFKNITNGITPRKWLLEANPDLAHLITEKIGNGWIKDLYELKNLIPLASEKTFQKKWAEVKRKNKTALAEFIKAKLGITINPDSIFDIQTKRIHEYKRQLLNILHVISLYNGLKEEPSKKIVPRTVIFGGKAAPSYHMAKLIIKLITSVADKINNDPEIDNQIKVIFMPNYRVSLAQKIIPSADLSEQISTAGMEASGTGNMKFSLNGALTIGTLDGANIEIMEEVGKENIFIFGLRAEEVEEKKVNGYDPCAIYESNPILKKTVDFIDSGFFSEDKKNLFKPIIQSLLTFGDRYFVLADFEDYCNMQKQVSQLYLDQKKWRRSSILNTAQMGKFSSDRSVLEYARNIWNVEPISF